MAISTLAELKTALNSWTKRGDLSSYAEDLILMGEKWIFRKARTRDMESALSVAISSGVAAIPSGFIALKNVRISGQTSRLRIRPSNYIYDKYPNRSGGSLPEAIGVEGSNFIFGPYPSAYTILGTYYAAPTSVISSANAVFTANPDLYLFAALAETEPFLKNDKRVALWTAKRDQILADVNAVSQESRYGDNLAVETA